MAFAESFRDSLLQALSTQSGSSWTAAVTAPEAAAAESPDPFHAIFTLEGSLNGDLHLNLPAEAALRLASALLGQPAEAMGDAQRDALTEFFDALLPDFCTASAAAHGVFTAALTVTAEPSPAGLDPQTLAILDAQGVELRLQLLLDSDLAASLAAQDLAREPVPAEPAPAPPVASTPAEAAPVAAKPAPAAPAQPLRTVYENPADATALPYQPVPTDPVNLDLVLEVELNVTLRFGQRLLTLREVLELTSGSVVELDRQVEEPVELLLDGKVIARGEAVVIDGNYGLRVTEVPQQFTTTMLR
jgi:flagellar motor switch protein FliN/FliY